MFMKPLLLRILEFIVLTMLCAAVSYVYAEETPIQSGVLTFTDPQGKSGSALLMNTDVRMEISGMIARVWSVQHFENTTDEWQEGVYLFPLPENAAVDHLEMMIGERKIRGEIQEKKQAEATYQKAKKEGKKTSVVHQRRPNLFTTKVANIGPRETVSVEISYLQKLQYRDGEFRLTFPLTLTPRFIPGAPTLEPPSLHGWGVNTDEVTDAKDITPFQMYLSEMVADEAGAQNRAQTHRASMNIQLAPGFTLAQVQSLYHDVKVNREQQRYQIQFSNGYETMDRDFVLQWKPALSDKPSMALFTEQWEQDHFGLLMVMPPELAVSEQNSIDRDVLFVLDTSGSMGGQSIEQAKQALINGLRKLNPQDRFNVIEFNDKAQPVFGQNKTADQLALAKAIRFVRNLNANGGTNIHAALNLAASLLKPLSEQDSNRQQQIIFITDGSVGNEESLFKTIQGYSTNRRLFTVGIGSAPNRYFMRKAAEFGRGSYTYIGDTGEVESAMTKLFAKIAAPQFMNINVSSSLNPDLEVHPQIIPDLYKGEPLMVLLKSQYPLDSLGISGQLVASEWQQTLSNIERSQSGVATLFGREKIESLEDQRVVMNDEEVNQAILNTALKFKLVSRHTSLVAVEEVVERPAEAGMGLSNVANLMPSGATMAAPNQMAYPATASPAIESLQRSLVLGLITLLLAVVAMYKPVKLHR
jgi:Ca-activated chloride channel family protein